METIQRILVQKVNGFGDFVVFIPTLMAIRRLFPNAEITLVTSGIGKELSNLFSLTDKIIEIELSQYRRILLHPLQFIKFIKKFSSYDLSISSHDECSTSYVLSKGLNVPRRFGIVNNARCNFLLTDSIVNNYSLPACINDHRIIDLLCNRLSLNIPSRYSLFFNSCPSIQYHLPGNPEINNLKPYVIIHPHCKLDYRNWGLARFATLSERLATKYNWLNVIFMSDESDRPILRNKNIHIYPKRSIGAFSVLLKESTLLIGNNSGPMHLAGFLGVPVVSICGPSAKNWYLYWNKTGLNRSIVADLDCIPCEKEFHIPGQCRRKDEERLCMNMVSVEQVMSAVDEILSSLPVMPEP